VRSVRTVRGERGEQWKDRGYGVRVFQAARVDVVLVDLMRLCFDQTQMQVGLKFTPTSYSSTS
jgi:hypothetical protein